MPFLRSLNCTAPKWRSDLPWPITGLYYVSAFMGPISAGPVVGMLARDWRAAVIGLLLGAGITFLNAWLSDRFVDPLIARFQDTLRKGMLRVIVNAVGFVWVFALSALAMIAPVVVFGGGVLTRIP